MAVKKPKTRIAEFERISFEQVSLRVKRGPGMTNEDLMVYVSIHDTGMKVELVTTLDDDSVQVEERHFAWPAK